MVVEEYKHDHVHSPCRRPCRGHGIPQRRVERHCGVGESLAVRHDRVRGLPAGLLSQIWQQDQMLKSHPTLEIRILPSRSKRTWISMHTPAPTLGGFGWSK